MQWEKEKRSSSDVRRYPYHAGQSELDWITGHVLKGLQTSHFQPGLDGEEKERIPHILHHASHAWGTEVDVVVEGTSVIALLTYCHRSPRNPWRKSHARPDPP